MNPIELAHAAVLSLRERLITDDDCQRIAAHIAAGAHRGEPETGTTTAHAGHTEPATGGPGRDGQSSKGDPAVASPTLPNRNAAESGRHRTTAA